MEGRSLAAGRVGRDRFRLGPRENWGEAWSISIRWALCGYASRADRADKCSAGGNKNESMLVRYSSVRYSHRLGYQLGQGSLRPWGELWSPKSLDDFSAPLSSSTWSTPALEFVTRNKALSRDGSRQVAHQRLGAGLERVRARRRSSGMTTLAPQNAQSPAGPLELV